MLFLLGHWERPLIRPALDPREGRPTHPRPLLLDELSHRSLQLHCVLFVTVLAAEDMAQGPEAATAVAVDRDPLLWHPVARDGGRRHGLGCEVGCHQIS